MAIDIKNLNHNQLNDLISKAQVRQNELRKEKVVKLREKVHALIKAEGYTFEDIFGSARGKAKRGTGSVAPKYRNPGQSRTDLVRPRQASALVQRRAEGRQEGKGSGDLIRRSTRGFTSNTPAHAPAFFSLHWINLKRSARGNQQIAEHQARHQRYQQGQQQHVRYPCPATYRVPADRTRCENRHCPAPATKCPVHAPPRPGAARTAHRYWRMRSSSKPPRNTPNGAPGRWARNLAAPARGQIAHDHRHDHHRPIAPGRAEQNGEGNRCHQQRGIIGPCRQRAATQNRAHRYPARRKPAWPPRYRR